MTKATGARLTRDEFRRALEAHGADRLRWPIEVRAGAAGLLASDPAAARLYAEAEALEMVLDHAPRVAAERMPALVDRIMAAAERTPRVAAVNSGARKPVEASTPVAPAWPGLAGRLKVGRSFGGGGGGAVLAASLVFGLLVGGTGITHPAISALEELTGLSFGAAHTSAALAQLDDALDEEHL